MQVVGNSHIMVSLDIISTSCGFCSLDSVGIGEFAVDGLVLGVAGSWCVKVSAITVPGSDTFNVLRRRQLVFYMCITWRSSRDKLSDILLSSHYLENQFFTKLSILLAKGTDSPLCS